MTITDELDMANTNAPLVATRGLSVEYRTRGGLFAPAHQSLNAVDGVDLRIECGEKLGLVGETGCGKSTLGRALVRLREPSAGTVEFDGVDLAGLTHEQLRAMRRRMQFVFQDPYGSLNPRKRVRTTLSEPMKVHGLARKGGEVRQVSELLERVGLDQSVLGRYPNELSGGQRQRVGIARVLAVEPEFIIFDEPVSALDVSLRGQLLNLLMDLHESFGLTYVFIAHDLSVVRRISDRVAVMHLGRIVELGQAEDVYGSPAHPYTRALLSAVPVVEPSFTRKRKRLVLTGELPNPLDPPKGCRFHPRCWLYQRLDRPSACTNLDPALRDSGDGHAVACHFASEAATADLGTNPSATSTLILGTPAHLRAGQSSDVVSAGGDDNEPKATSRQAGQ